MGEGDYNIILYYYYCVVLTFVHYQLHHVYFFTIVCNWMKSEISRIIINACTCDRWTEKYTYLYMITICIYGIPYRQFENKLKSNNRKISNSHFVLKVIYKWSIPTTFIVV